jgi:hypothetical protein
MATTKSGGEINFLEVTQNEHFQNLAQIIRRPFNSLNWRSNHNNIPFWSMLKEVMSVKSAEYFRKPEGRNEFIGRFTSLLISLAQSDTELSYTTGDMDWFVGVMNGEFALPIMSMLFAYASAPTDMLTPAEIAEITSTSESSWRNRAAAGELVGAVKRGRQWLIPRAVIKSYGFTDNGLSPEEE